MSRFRMPRQAAVLAVVALCGASAVLAGCQDQRNEFNPVRVLCPGDFDPVTNQCNIDTGGSPSQ